MTYSLRPYQQTAVDRARLAIASGCRSLVLWAPTGAGKTVIACHIIDAAKTKNTRTLFVAHRTELITQCSDKLKENGIPHGIIKAGFAPDHRQQVQLASVQTYTRRISKIEHGFRLIIIDEAHHASSESYKKVLLENLQAIRIGLTATPYRLDGKPLGGDLFQLLIEVSNVQELTDQGYLVPSRVFRGEKVDLTGVHKTAGDYNLEELAQRMDQPKVTGNIIKEWLRLARGRPTICFATSIAHSEAIVEAFLGAGVRAVHLDGTMNAERRDEINRGFRSGKYELVSNCAVWTEGADFPMCSCVIGARPTQSRSLWRQCAGRGLRPSPETLKRDCLILDHANWCEHGYLTDPDHVTLTDGCQKKDSEQQWKCAECGALLKSRPRVCPSCGAIHEQQQTELGLDLPGGIADDGYILVEVKPTRAKPATKKIWSERGAEFRFLEDMQTAFENGYKPAYASVRYKARMGHWPSKELKAKSPFRTAFRKIDGKFTEEWA